MASAVTSSLLFPFSGFSASSLHCDLCCSFQSSSCQLSEGGTHRRGRERGRTSQQWRLRRHQELRTELRWGFTKREAGCSKEGAEAKTQRAHHVQLKHCQAAFLRPPSARCVQPRPAPSRHPHQHACPRNSDDSVCFSELEDDAWQHQVQRGDAWQHQVNILTGLIASVFSHRPPPRRYFPGTAGGALNPNLKTHLPETLNLEPLTVTLYLYPRPSTLNPPESEPAHR